ncbi:MAG: hypothetical protein HY887_03795 [Deltaproteobacteria bacterium]|nr:hypothetical protein [Deltaproteobacteria bacterium]
MNAVLGALVALSLFFFVRNMVSGSKKAPTGNPVTSESKEIRSRHSLTDYAPILRNNPFGFAAGELKPLTAQPQHEAPSISAADFTLIGTVAGAKESSYAILIDKGGTQEIFKAGENVFGYGILETVKKDRVYITAGDMPVEVLLSDVIFNKDTVRRDEPSTSMPRDKHGGRRARGDAIGQAEPSTSIAKRTAEGAYAVDRQRIIKAMENMGDVMTDARFIPNIVEGAAKGFILNEVKGGGLFNSLGLQNGDVLLSVNDFDISSPEAALQAFTALKGMDRVQLNVIRDGSNTTLTYQLR